LKEKKLHKVYIVGAGPGDPDLLTVKAANLLKNYPDVVIRDRLISDEIIALIKPDAEIIYAGKEPDFHHMNQEQINSAIVGNTLEGKKVLRLKGGDPFIFGRGGEEIEELQSNNLEYEIVPGVTACLSAASIGSVPLTYRSVSDGVYIVSGHNYQGEEPSLDYKALAEGRNTIVLYMAVKNFGIIIKRLIENGLKPETPFYAIQNASMKDEKFCKGIISEGEAILEQSKITNPAVIIIGKVAKKTQI
jgi:uroporphyrin-III C-methyltransferase